MVDDGQAKLILLAMLAIVGAIGATGLRAALRNGRINRRTILIERDTDPQEFRRATRTRALLLAFLAAAFAAILIFY